jgi:hypothetical protein
MYSRKFLVIFGLIFTSACGPIYSPTLAGPIFIVTETPTSTPGSMGSPTPTPSIEFALVPTGSYFTLNRDSNCYNGPAVTYLVVTKLRSGETVDVVGRNNDSSWWRIVKGPSVDCWVANEWGAFYGEFALIPITSSEYITKAALTPTRARPTSATLNAGGSIQSTATNPPVINTFVQATNTPPPVINTPRPTNTRRPPTDPPPTNPPPTNPPPTNPPPPDPPPTDPPPTDPPPPDPPPTDPPPTDPPPPICLPIICP